jgi:hypothetical protein
MSARDYPRLDIVPFGRLLLDSGDLDPVYAALVEAELPHPQLSRWLVAYWCTYHAGFASWASDATDDEFWDIMAVAACNADAAPAPGNIGRWPRAAERRHWRGAAALKSVNGLARAYLTATNFVDELSTLPEKGLLSYEIVRARVKRQYAFGDWIAFKIADMLERVCDVPSTSATLHSCTMIRARRPLCCGALTTDTLRASRRS